MQETNHGAVSRVRPGAAARLYASEDGIGVLYLREVPEQVGDLLLGADASNPRAVWTAPEIAPAYGHADRHAIVYVDPDDDRRRGLLIRERGRVTLDCRTRLKQAEVPAEVLVRDKPERRRVVLLAGHRDGWCVLVTQPPHATGGHGVKVAVIAAGGAVRPLDVRYVGATGSPVLTDEGMLFLDPPVLGDAELTELTPDRYRAVLRTLPDPAIAGS